MAYIDLQAISSHDQTKEPAPLCEPTVVPNAFLTGMAIDVQDMCVRILMCGVVGANAATAPEKWCSVSYGYGTLAELVIPPDGPEVLRVDGKITELADFALTPEQFTYATIDYASEGIEYKKQKILIVLDRVFWPCDKK
jgi:hypothetical protein